LEKADILEMTVHCVKNLRQRQSSGNTVTIIIIIIIIIVIIVDVHGFCGKCAAEIVGLQ